jgi:hypothetical protein
MAILVQETRDIVLRLLARELEDQTLLVRARFAIGIIALFVIGLLSVALPAAVLVR